MTLLRNRLTDESNRDVRENETMTHDVARLVFGSVNVAGDGSVEVSKTDDESH